MVKEERTHDKAIYLKEDRYDEPKEIFKLLVDLLKAANLPSDDFTACDFGCATGEFLYYFKQHFPLAQCIGIDFVPDLVERAKERVPEVDFRQGSVLERDILPESCLDVAYLQGVLSIFDEFEPCLANLLYWSKPGARIYVFGAFNPHPVDVWVKYRRCDDPNREHREPGWNIFSKQSLSSFLADNYPTTSHRFLPFTPSLELSEREDDPVRSWTFRDESGSTLFRNGLSLMLNLEVLEISC